MNLWDVLILLAVAALVLTAIWRVRKGKAGGCSCGSGGCSGSCADCACGCEKKKKSN